MSLSTFSGSWYGTFYYSKQVEAHNFEAVFEEKDGAISGSIVDQEKMLTATVSGTASFSKLKFVKTYANKSAPDVIYEGSLSADAKFVTGKWQIPPLSHGTWMAWRVDLEN